MRSVDALVAEKVMGYTFWQNYSHNGIRQVEACEHGETPSMVTNGNQVDHLARRGCWPIGVVPAFSTDPAAAMAVVDKIKKDNPAWTFQLTERGVVHEASFYTNTWRTTSDLTGPIAHRAGSSTRELAICLAALRSVACPESEIEEALKGAAE